MNMKKSGIIVGVLLIGIALIVTMLTTKINKKGEATKPPFSATQDKGSTNNKNNGVSNNVQNNNVNTNNENNNVNNNSNINTDITNPNKPNNSVNNSSNGNQSIIEVADDTIVNPTKVSNEIMVVRKKRTVLIDSAVNSNEGKQLVNVVDLYMGDNKPISLYVNRVVYDGLEVGDKLNIKYNLYVNNKGVEIPLVLEATKVNS